MTTEQYAAWLIETCAKPAEERDTLLELEGPWDLRRGVIGLADKLETEQIECTVARRFLTEERAELDAAAKLLRIWRRHPDRTSIEDAEVMTDEFLARHEGR